MLAALQWDPACCRDRPFCLPSPYKCRWELFSFYYGVQCLCVRVPCSRTPGPGVSPLLRCWPLIPHLPVLVPCAPIGCFLKTGSYGEKSV